MISTTVFPLSATMFGSFSLSSANSSRQQSSIRLPLPFPTSYVPPFGAFTLTARSVSSDSATAIFSFRFSGIKRCYHQIGQGITTTSTGNTFRDCRGCCGNSEFYSPANISLSLIWWLRNVSQSKPVLCSTVSFAHPPMQIGRYLHFKHWGRLPELKVSI